MARVYTRRPWKERFWSKVQVTGNCWLWLGSKSPAGYGQFFKGEHDRKEPLQLAHRVAYQQFYGTIPDGMHLLHSCDNPACVKPTHLTPGTAKENAQDREQKGRGNAPRGEQQGHAKLTASQVMEIRDLLKTRTQADIAAQFGVCRQTIGKIKRGQSWKHLQEAI